VGVALLEYRLNLDTTVNYYYRGSGTVVINGFADNARINTNVAFQTIGFFDGEWVYDYDHNIWHIVKLTGTTDDFIWTAYNGETYKEFRTYEIFNFKTAPHIWVTHYLTKIEEYNTLVAQIELKMKNEGMNQADISSASPTFKNLLDIINELNWRAEIAAQSHQFGNTGGGGSGGYFRFNMEGEEYKIKIPLLMMLAKSIKAKPNKAEIERKRRMSLQKAGKLK
jgi:hypothetical protein